MQLSNAALDSFPIAPLFYVHMGASQRTIAKDLGELVRRWKRKHSILERRVHTEKLQSYLDVWDQREGWVNGRYERSRERTFLEIARALKESPSSVASRYRSAFEMITGHAFSPRLWFRLYGPV
jgi:hypothetical protein